MYIALYRKSNVISEYVASTIEGAIDRFKKSDVEPICVAQDWNYEIVWLGEGYDEPNAKSILYSYLNEQINGRKIANWDLAW